MSKLSRRSENSLSEESLPVRRFQAFTRDCAESILSTSCWEDISSENIKTDFSWLTAVIRAMSRARVVLPMDGLAASIIISELCNPESRPSKSLKPVGRPRRAPLFS